MTRHAQPHRNVADLATVLSAAAADPLVKVAASGTRPPAGLGTAYRETERRCATPLSSSVVPPAWQQLIRPAPHRRSET